MTSFRRPDPPDRALRAAADAAAAAWQQAVALFDRDQLIETVREGADKTATTRLDELVESAVLRAVEPYGVNILSEEIGHIDNGSETTLIIDPVDGTGNAAAGVPFSAFTGAVARDGRFVEGLTRWLDTGREWWAHVDRPGEYATSGRRRMSGAIVSMIRPKHDPRGFLAVAARVDRARVLGSSSIEAALVASGNLDAALDPGSDTHRIVDLAAAVVLVESAGGVVVDLHGRPLGFTTDITGRWSGIAAASQDLADELIDVVLGSCQPAELTPS